MIDFLETPRSAMILAWPNILAAEMPTTLSLKIYMSVISLKQRII